MKNQYFGDLNDYRKYGLIREFENFYNSQVDVCFMLTEDDGSRDGQKLKYLLDHNKWHSFDFELYELLRMDVTSGNRDINNAKKFLKGQLFLEVLNYGKEHRKKYFHKLNKIFKESDIIFFDPDNGLEVKSVPIGRKNSERYLYYNELKRFYDRGHGILIYQHFARKNRDYQILSIANKIWSRSITDIILFIKTSMVVFIFLPQFKHLPRINEFALHIEEKWKGQFNLKILEK